MVQSYSSNHNWIEWESMGNCRDGCMFRPAYSLLHRYTFGSLLECFAVPFFDA